LEVLHSRRPYSVENQPQNELALRRLLDYARGQGISVRVVITPFLPVQKTKMKNFETWRDHLFELGVRRDELYDYSGRFDSVEYFHDGVHLNTAGTEKLFELMVAEGVYDPKNSRKLGAASDLHTR
jgi:hypothetical protein